MDGNGKKPSKNGDGKPSDESARHDSKPDANKQPVGGNGTDLSQIQHNNKALAAETEVRVNRIIELIVEGRRNDEIQRSIRTEFGLAESTVAKYIRKARTRLLAPLGNPMDMVAEKHQWYMDLVQGEDASITQKLLAQKQDTQLTGIMAAKRYDFRIQQVDEERMDVQKQVMRRLSTEQIRILQDVYEIEQEELAKLRPIEVQAHVQDVIDGYDGYGPLDRPPKNGNGKH